MLRCARAGMKIYGNVYKPLPNVEREHMYGNRAIIIIIQ